jgi:Ca2+-binding EF-hand superfamily protein
MAFLDKKLRTYFNRIDLNADGKISKEDFQDMASNFIAAGCVKDASKQADFTAKICGIWDKYLSKLGNDCTQEVFVGSVKSLIQSADGKATLQGSLTNFFHAIDTDGDGNISAEEFENFYKIIGLDASMAADSFAKIDENSDNSLSEDEFVTAGLLFFTSEDESSPSKSFWGPLL